jgi:hypothetical protein
MSLTEYTLPISGKKATIRRATGRDMVEADQLIPDEGGRISFQVAVLSRTVTIDGHIKTFDEFQELDHEDIDFLSKIRVPVEPHPAPPTN